MPSPAMLHGRADRASLKRTYPHIDEFWEDIVGLVSSKFPTMECKEDLRRRIDEVARYVPFENLAISPQCGFSSTHHGNIMTVDQQAAKLRLCVETADEIWGNV